MYIYIYIYIYIYTTHDHLYPHIHTHAQTQVEGISNHTAAMTDDDEALNETVANATKCDEHCKYMDVFMYVSSM